MGRDRYPRIVRRYGDKRDRKDFRSSKVFFPVLTLLIMALIFILSAQPADDSQKLSDGLLYTIVSLLDGLVSDGVIDFLVEYIRKVAHFVIYLLLGWSMGHSLFAWMVPESEYDIRITPDPRNVSVGSSSAGRAWFLSLVLCIIYAISDEIHQRFVPGRSGEVRDVLLDTCGIIIGLLILLISISHKKHKMQKLAMKKLG